jgi:hypothetical protein
VGRVLLSQTSGPLDFHRATIVFRSLLDAGTRSSTEPFPRARHPDGVIATATLDLLVWLGRLLATDVYQRASIIDLSRSALNCLTPVPIAPRVMVSGVKLR